VGVSWRRRCFWGLAHSDAATASLLLNLEVVFTAVLAWIVFHEATSQRVVIGFAAIFAGGLALAWPAQLAVPGRSLGLVLIAAACLCWGLDNNFTRKISAADSRVIAAFKGLVAGTTNTVLALALGARVPTLPYLSGTLALGFLGYGVSLVLFIVALRHLGTARTGAYFATAPFIGTALAVFLYGQPVSGLFWIAALLMVVGVYLHVTEQHVHMHTHEPLRHTHAHVHDAHHQHQHPHKRFFRIDQSGVWARALTGDTRLRVAIVSRSTRVALTPLDGSSEPSR